MASRLDGIVEVVEVGSARNANELLSRGYTLLVIEQVANGIERKTKDGTAGFWVAKHLSYCFGRTQDQERFGGFLDELKQARKARDAASVEAGS